jgi:hypothetical protein
MRRHVEDFRRGYEQAGLPLETVVGRSKRAGPGNVRRKRGQSGV